MSNPFPATLEFKIHRSDGKISTFLAQGEPAVQNILEQIRRGKVFSQPSLVLADPNALAVYPGTAIARIDLQVDVNAEAFRNFDFIRDGGQKREITFETWETQINTLSKSDLTRQNILWEQGELVTTFGQIQLQNGSSICMEYRYSDNLPSVQDQRRFFQVVFSLAGFPFVPLSGGISILNPAQIIGCLFHPGGEPPANAWAVQSVEALNAA
jgi:hypothetical protein